MKSSNVLVKFLITPIIVNRWSQKEWQQLIQQAYVTNLMARVHFILNDNKLIKYVPNNVEWHFTSAHKVYLAHQQDVLNEVSVICNALKLANIAPVFLKGTAYLLADDKCNQGRLFSDVDIFVIKSELDSTEKMLHWNGWVGEEVDQHDEKYYRDWMHEIPPMTNTKTHMTIDVHHNLVPLVSRIKLNSDKLLETIETVGDYKILSMEDRILHSAVHLLLDGEFNQGFRDLHDLYLLISDGLSVNKDFLVVLYTRSQQLGFELILYYCLSLMSIVFNLDVDTRVTKEFEKNIKSPLTAKLVLKLFCQVLNPTEKLIKSYKYRISLFMLFIRSHWIKMPFQMLIPHLLYKAFITPYNEWKKAQKQNEEHN
ncbi:MAG: nucleotidyltransferase family protein [Alteromonadaceae bacterium]|nr:nucleotidyltransferase family protein [Alteromonadaceae bacterium]